VPARFFCLGAAVVAGSGQPRGVEIGQPRVVSEPGQPRGVAPTAADDNDTVDVVRHNNEFVNFRSGVMDWDFVPNGLNYCAGLVQYHFSVHNVSE